MDLPAYLRERSALVDAHLDGLMPRATTAPRVLHEAMRYLLFPGGKRLRPVLAMAAAEAVGGAPEAALPAAAAVELIHTYSLVHDDLPCMDDDRERRGRPTVHVKFGEAVAVLAGDALQALAFEVLAAAASCGTERAVLAFRDLARAVGSQGLVGGQIDDLAFESGAADAASVESIHERKSAALITASLVTGARLGGAQEAELDQLGRFGRMLGVAFQIVDDLLDRQDEDGCSLLQVVDEPTAVARATVLLDAALGLIENWGDRAEPLRELAHFAVRRKR